MVIRISVTDLRELKTCNITFHFFLVKTRLTRKTKCDKKRHHKDKWTIIQEVTSQKIEIR